MLMRGLGTDLIVMISRPMRGLTKKMHPMAQQHTDTQTSILWDSKTELTQLTDSVKSFRFHTSQINDPIPEY